MTCSVWGSKYGDPEVTFLGMISPVARSTSGLISQVLTPSISLGKRASGLGAVVWGPHGLGFQDLLNGLCELIKEPPWLLGRVLSSFPRQGPC